ncbi:MAG: helicase [Actinophytocola sp.]|nr:helicase [Actinophytocola sp.]
MRRDVPVIIDSANVLNVVGPGAYARGVTYARRGAVIRWVWSNSANSLLGTVRGNARSPYTTTARFAPSGGSVLDFDRGECSCPVGSNCKHVAALVLAATEQEKPQRPADDVSSLANWEKSLEALLEPRRQATEWTPLALELTLLRSPRGDAPTLNAKLVRPGKRGGWVAGELNWGKLATLYLYGDYDSAHVSVLQELYALFQSRNSTHYGYAYAYGDQKSIELSAFESPQLWPMLEQAVACGVRLVHGMRHLGELAPVADAEVCLDVTRDSASGDLIVTPILRIDGADSDAVPVRFIGQHAHGLVLVDRGVVAAERNQGSWPLRLAKLAKPVPQQLQRLVVDGTPLRIPAAAQARFRDEFYPQLRHTATVISSDQSFTPPAISEPTLVLHADYGADHALELSWEWAYDVGDSRVRFPVDQPGSADDGIRDPGAERLILDDLDGRLARFALVTTELARGRVVRGVRLSGIDTMRFSTEGLPLLDGQPGVAVETTGEQADYREAGDSLRIGLTADEPGEPGERDWFDLGVSITVEGREVPFTQVFTALARDESHLLLADGAYFSLQKPELQSLRRLIEEARGLQDSPSGQLRISRFQAGLWDELSQLGVVERQAAAWRQQVEGLLTLGTFEPPPVPATVEAQLRPYQHAGFGWLTFLWQSQLGGILADDMGLGKTLQTLAMISHAKQLGRGRTPPFLIIAPASVVANWAAEAERFTPDLHVVPIAETLARRGQSLAEAVEGADVVVTSYTLLRLDFETYAGGEWSGLVLDEAQFAKNHQSKVYRCARQLPAPFKLAITGTPMENNLMELWSLLSITAPGLFPNPARFREYYARPIERGQEPELLAQLRRRIKPLVKRRTKEQVAADLPEKQEQLLEVELSPRHRTIYQRHLQRERQKILGLLGDLDRNRFTILRSLTLLRQLSLHPALVDDEYADVGCGKIDALLEHLHEVVDGGHRALVFSQFTGFLDHVRARLDAAGVPYCYLDGKTRKRAEVIKQFKDGTAPVFLISLKAGGFGLNLTEADYCFLLDPWWNPATEAQAVDRTHRIGQTRNVMVYRLISADTIEEKVMALKARKAELFASVMTDGNAFGGGLDADDIRALFE